MLNRVSACALAACLAACSGDRVDAVQGQVRRVSSAVVDFGRIAVGDVATAELAFANDSRVEVVLRVGVVAPFGIPAATLRVPPGGEASATVVFEPTAAGSFHGSLTATSSEGSSHTIALTGIALDATCTVNDACVSMHFDAAIGACVASAAPDGTACETTCVTGACDDGACRGSFRNCDDGNACTADGCGPSGCVHAPVGCAAPTDPCQVAVCDPLQGCTVTSAPDGTSCGRKNGCDAVDVCISGVCTTQPVPDGATCGLATPCQSAGVCSGGTCDRQAPSILHPAWTWSAGASVIAWSGLADERGQLFFTESHPDGTSDLVSLSASGTLRFRTRLPAVAPEDPQDSTRALLLTDDSVIVARGRTLSAWRSSDGGARWTLDMMTVIGPDLSSKGTPTSASMRLAVHPRGNELLVRVMGVAVSTDSGYPNSTWATFWVGVDASRGVAQLEAIDAEQSLMSDEQGNLISSLQLASGYAEVSTFGATFGGRMWGLVGCGIKSDDEACVDLAAKTLLYELPVTLVSGIVTNGTNTYAIGSLATLDPNRCNGNPTGPALLASIDDRGARSWSVPGAIGAPLLTSTGGALVRTNTALALFEASGQNTFTCAVGLPIGGDWTAPRRSVLTHGYWIETTDLHTLVAYRVPGVELATTGWVTFDGNLRRNRRPLAP